MGLSVVTMSCKFPVVSCHPLGFPSTFVSCPSFGVTRCGLLHSNSSVEMVVSVRRGRQPVQEDGILFAVLTLPSLRSGSEKVGDVDSIVGVHHGWVFLCGNELCEASRMRCIQGNVYPQASRVGTPDELLQQSKLSGLLHWSSVRIPFDTALARAEVSTNCRHEASSESLCAGGRSSHHYKRMPSELRPSLPPRRRYLASSK
ncbi:hypothetical protein Acr_11g0008680 [Actinidia rufa]|uniref:Uncharacterized protein n=1 Tax=Actinidia rufa TaxID=165716 RepID=A0A7J0FCZ9_9ERIC|nr:hypothetical protein Acr_11g0008680 [Actinidia rufa]